MARLSERSGLLWLMAASPTIWAAHFMLCYVTAAIWCGMVVGRDGPLSTARVAIGAYTVVALAAIGTIAYVGFRRHRFRGGREPHDADTPEDRHRFLGYSTFLLSSLSGVAVIWSALAAVFIERCQ